MELEKEEQILDIYKNIKIIKIVDLGKPNFMSE